MGTLLLHVYYSVIYSSQQHQCYKGEVFQSAFRLVISGNTVSVFVLYFVLFRIFIQIVFKIYGLLETILNIDSNSFFPEQNIVKCVFCSVCLKSRIRETLSLSTCVDSITDLNETR